jgi:DNA-directed RNA polymerase specialized sigma24 family protein
MTINRRHLLGSLAAVAACEPIASTAFPVGGLLGLGDQRQGVSKLDKLTSRERRVIEARVLADKPMTLEELAAEFCVCRARVRQLEARVLEKMGADYQTKLLHSRVVRSMIERYNGNT